MDVSSVIVQNILSPSILFFALGILAGFVKSDLDVPSSISSYLSIYLMMAIGFKGGAAMSATSDISSCQLLMILSGVVISFVIPFIGFSILRFFTNLDVPTAAAVAAHYGSISIVTFATATSFLKSQGVSYEGYIVAIVALMEAPAILSGLYLAHRYAPQTRGHQQEEKRLSREIFTNGAILLLLGSFVIGWVSGSSGMEKLHGFLVDPFQGFLCLFLLDMGLFVSKNIHQLKGVSLSVACFGLYMPILGASLGLLVGCTLGVGLGTVTLFAILCASASYIAVPAAMRLALPEAKASVYVPLSLAITFPFNVILGIPLIYKVASYLI